MNTEWALQKLEDLQAAVDIGRELKKTGPAGAGQRRANARDIELQKVPVTAIANELFDNFGWWSDGYEAMTKLIQRMRGALLFEKEIAENLADAAPRLRAEELHPWVWSAARSLWDSRHFGDAVETAAKKVNAELQNKLNRRDVSDARLCAEAFRIEAPDLEKARLRFDGIRTSETWRTRQEGAMSFGRGVFMAIRNPLAHQGSPDLGEHEALEQLAAFSLLARWIEDATVETCEPGN